MPSSSMELRLEIYTAEGWMPVVAVDNLTRAVIKNYIDKRFFEDEANPACSLILILALCCFLLLKIQQLLKSLMVGLNLVYDTLF